MQGYNITNKHTHKMQNECGRLTKTIKDGHMQRRLAQKQIKMLKHLTDLNFSNLEKSFLLVFLLKKTLQFQLQVVISITSCNLNYKL